MYLLFARRTQETRFSLIHPDRQANQQSQTNPTHRAFLPLPSRPTSLQPLTLDCRPRISPHFRRASVIPLWRRDGLLLAGAGPVELVCVQTHLPEDRFLASGGLPRLGERRRPAQPFAEAVQRVPVVELGPRWAAAGAGFRLCRLDDRHADGGCRAGVLFSSRG